MSESVGPCEYVCARCGRGEDVISLAALRALAQGEPFEDVAGDYCVSLDIRRAAAPHAGR